MTRGWLDSTGQRWRARLTYGALSLQMASFAWLFVRKESSWAMIAFGLHALFLVLSIVGIVSVRCRVCDELVLWWALKSPNPVATLNQLEACPNCGSITGRESLWNRNSRNGER